MTDAIDFSQVVILNSPDVHNYAVTSEILEFGLLSEHLYLKHTRQGAWPPVPFQDATQEATIWIFLFIGGKWFGAGVERLRPNQIDKPEPPPSQLAANWYYDVNRWGPMVNHQPAPGEIVGFCVVAGDSRGFGAQSVQERSPIVLVEWPTTDAGRNYPPFATLPDDHAPPPPPPPPDDDNPLHVAELIAAIDDNTKTTLETQRLLRDVVARLDRLAVQGVRLHL